MSRYKKGKTNLDFTEARDSEWPSKCNQNIFDLNYILGVHFVEGCQLAGLFVNVSALALTCIVVVLASIVGFCSAACASALLLVSASSSYIFSSTATTCSRQSKNCVRFALYMYMTNTCMHHSTEK